MTVGFIGAGQLGEPMVLRLLGAGHPVLVYARRDEVRERLSRHGAELADSVADVAANSDILISCLFSDAQLREIGLGCDGFVANTKSGSVVVSHTTGTLSTLNELAASSDAPPVILDAPVSGTADDVAEGTLTVLVGGPDEAVERARPVLAAYADPIVATGELGTALDIKLINNLLFAANSQLVAAAAELGQSLGVSPARLLDALTVCSGGSKASMHAHRIGGIETFADLAAPFLRKDTAAILEAADEKGFGLGLLGSVVESGPLELT